MEIKNYNVRKIDWIETEDDLSNVEHLMMYNISDLSDTTEFSLTINEDGSISVDVEDAKPNFVNQALKDLSEFITEESQKKVLPL